ncbi:hypothetical protein ACFOQM_23235 [Paenibacillus sp. GCM10012307]|uniref:Siphovirus-type tail component C-terminal domain-containing protein n=1 Tax=Paenibacillus roseus TaxID=2798579 RepID=A0A934J6F1_9BACL|nr:hypothetical protein [Paenibacillus roseus]MBJ6364139.1 hypothetical protein [Paenibacillus roseus]
MFGPFNRLPLDRAPDMTSSIFGGGVVEVQTEVSGGFLRDIVGGGLASVETQAWAEFLRDILGGGAVSVDTEVKASFIREIKGGGLVEVNVQVWADAYRNRVERIELTGPFAPGDKIVIDSAKLRATKNGAFLNYEGDFFNFWPGPNDLTYTDTETGRTWSVRVTYRDRFI